MSGDDILTRLAENNARRRAALREYSAVREYKLRNARFGKEFTAAVRMSYASGEGAKFTVVNTEGSEKLAHIIDRVLTEEQDMSRAPDGARHEISPANYTAHPLGIESIAGQKCYVVELRPRTKSKYFIEGKAWIEASTYTVVRLEGRMAGTVSAFLGRPFYTAEFTEVDGFWLPSHTRIITSSFLLGVSEMDVWYRDYALPSETAAAR